jgi:thioredoxin-like negative regulator of GroEL
MSKIVSVTNDNFQASLDKAKTMVLAVFTASDCKQSKQQKQVLEYVASSTEQLLVAEANVDENSVAVADLKIKSIPTLVLFHMGFPVATWTRNFYTKEDVVRAVFGE